MERSPPFYGLVKWRLGSVLANQWKIRKAMIRIGIGTPRSQNRPYFICLNPKTSFVRTVLCRLEIG
jgi:hypothetical protein